MFSFVLDDSPQLTCGPGEATVSEMDRKERRDRKDQFQFLHHFYLNTWSF